MLCDEECFFGKIGERIFGKIRILDGLVVLVERFTDSG